MSPQTPSAAASAAPAAAKAGKPLATVSRPAGPAGVPAAAPVSTTAEPPTAARFLNRDLSWLEFNRRVLHEALDPRTPLLERVKFLAIFSSNLDEFFMKRVGLIRGDAESGHDSRSPDGRTPREVFAACRQVVVGLQEEQARCWEEELLPALKREGIHLIGYADLTQDERREVDAWFNANVFPVLTPLAVDPGHRFPFISNLSENLGITLQQPGDPEHLFARVKIPDVLPRLIQVPPQPARPEGSGPVRLVPLEEIIQNNLNDLFPGMTIVEVMPFRVTRNAAVERDEDPADLLQSVEDELRMRRFAKAVRVETGRRPAPGILDRLLRALGLQETDVYSRGGPLEYGDLFRLVELNRSDLKAPPWRPVAPPRLADENADVFAAIRERDILLHHPYESFSASVERFISAAARDPDVLAIKQTLYRTSPDSPFVATLIRAAEQGKQVACLVEVRARFDESRNVRFARLLEKNGVHVAYGVMGYKTHCKCSLVVRRESDGLRCYTHLGTGNYNPGTAQLYTDFGLLTCDTRIGEDAVNLFNYLTGRSLLKEYNDLIVAPHAMRERFTAMIERETAIARAGGTGRIVAKMNSLEDKAMTERLYEASAAGVKVTLFVRGFCCLRPGVPGLSENIRVLSIVGRFLEHSRVYHFGQGHADPLDGGWYISSADWMYRNLNSRVEVAAPIKERAARARIARIIDVMLADCRDAWEMRPDGSYAPRSPTVDAPAGSPESDGTFATLMRETGGG